MLDNLEGKSQRVVENNAKRYLEHAKSNFKMRLAQIEGENRNNGRNSVHISEPSEDSQQSDQDNMDEADQRQNNYPNPFRNLVDQLCALEPNQDHLAIING